MPHPIKSYKDLIVWQRGHELVLFTYKTTKGFPKDELFALTSQMRRAAVSVTSNFAEGFARKSSKDREHFYVMAYGSVIELDNHYQIAKDLLYLKEADYSIAIDLIEQTAKLTNALLRAHRSQKSKL